LPVTLTSTAHRSAVDVDLAQVTYWVGESPYDVTLTSSHLMKVKRAGDPCGHWLPVQAGAVQAGDFLMTAKQRIANVVDVEVYSEAQEVVEIALSERSATCFVSTWAGETMSSLDAFVEVFGSPACDVPFVEILNFKWRPKNFFAMLSDYPELEACRNDLIAASMSFDLKKWNLGPGMGFFSPELAPAIRSALISRIENGHPLTHSDIVVDAKFKPTVCRFMENHGRRQRVGITILPLISSPQPLKFGFYDNLSAAERGPRSSCTRSTPNAYARRASRDPRAKPYPNGAH